MYSLACWTFYRYVFEFLNLYADSIIFYVHIILLLYKKKIHYRKYKDKYNIHGPGLQNAGLQNIFLLILVN